MLYQVMGVRIYSFDFVDERTGERVSGKNVELHTVHKNYKHNNFSGDCVEIVKIKRQLLDFDDGQIMALAGKTVKLDVVPGSGQTVGLEIVK